MTCSDLWWWVVFEHSELSLWQGNENTLHAIRGQIAAEKKFGFFQWNLSMHDLIQRLLCNFLEKDGFELNQRGQRVCFAKPAHVQIFRCRIRPSATVSRFYASRVATCFPVSQDRGLFALFEGNSRCSWTLSKWKNVSRPPDAQERAYGLKQDAFKR